MRAVCDYVGYRKFDMCGKAQSEAIPKRMLCQLGYFGNTDLL